MSALFALWPYKFDICKRNFVSEIPVIMHGWKEKKSQVIFIEKPYFRVFVAMIRIA